MLSTAAYAPETLTRTDVDATRGPLVLEFGTDGCGWCRSAQPHIRAAFAQVDASLTHLKVEDGPGRPLGRSFRIKLWPTLVFLKDGHEISRLVRPDNAEDIAAALRAIR